MRVNTILYGTMALVAAMTQAAPVAEPQSHGLLARAAAGKAPAAAGGKGTSSGGGLLSGLKGIFGGGKTTPPPKEAPPPPKENPAPPKETPAAPKETPAAPKTDAPPAKTEPAKTEPAKTEPAKTTSPSPTTAATSKTSTTSSASSSSAEPEESAPACALYVQPDAIHLSTRELEARAGEEYFFRFEDPVSLTTGILPLAARNGGKDFDDQAYKWISTDASRVQRGNMKGRQPTVFVMPKGTRAQVLGAAKDFDESRDAQQAQDFVTKDNEPGDVGINGVRPAADGKLPLDTFRDKVLRTVTVKNNKGKLTFQTITKGKASNTASKADQAALKGFCG